MKQAKSTATAHTSTSTRRVQDEEEKGSVSNYCRPLEMLLHVPVEQAQFLIEERVLELLLLVDIMRQ